MSIAAINQEIVILKERLTATRQEIIALEEALKDARLRLANEALRKLQGTQSQGTAGTTLGSAAAFNPEDPPYNIKPQKASTNGGRRKKNPKRRSTRRRC